MEWTLAKKTNIVKINIGGQLFQSTDKTLEPRQYLVQILRADVNTELIKDENGAIFIDR